MKRNTNIKYLRSCGDNFVLVRIKKEVYYYDIEDNKLYTAIVDAHCGDYIDYHIGKKADQSLVTLELVQMILHYQYSEKIGRYSFLESTIESKNNLIEKILNCKKENK